MIYDNITPPDLHQTPFSFGRSSPRHVTAHMTASANLSSPHRWSRATGRRPPRMEREEAQIRGPRSGLHPAGPRAPDAVRAPSWCPSLRKSGRVRSPSPPNLIPIPEPQIQCVEPPVRVLSADSSPCGVSATCRPIDGLERKSCSLPTSLSKRENV